MADKLPEIKKIVVEEGGEKSAPIFIPQSGDKVYDHELELWAVENEQKKMRNKRPVEPSRVSLEDRKAAVREIAAWRERRKQGKRYY